MSYSRQEQEVIFTQFLTRVLQDPTNMMLDHGAGAPTEEQRLSHVSHQQFDIDMNRQDLPWESRLFRKDFLNIFPNEGGEEFEGSGGLRMTIETEFTVLQRPDVNPVTGRITRHPPIVVKRYTSTYGPFGGNSTIDELPAFQQALFMLENEIFRDPPTAYLEEAQQQARERRERPAPGSGGGPSVSAFILERIGTVPQFLEQITVIREGLVNSDPGGPARVEKEQDLIRQRYSVEVLSIAISGGNAMIRVAWIGGEEGRTEHTIEGAVSQEAADRWDRITEAFDSGFQSPPPEDSYEQPNFDPNPGLDPYGNPILGPGGVPEGELVLYPEEREIQRLLHYWRETTMDPRGAEVARLDEEWTSYGIQSIVVRTEPLSETHEAVISISVVYNQGNRYTSARGRAATFTPASRIRVLALEQRQDLRSEIRVLEMQNELIAIDDMIDDLEELKEAVNDPDTDFETNDVIRGIDQIILKIDELKTKANREPEGQTRNSILMELESKREPLLEDKAAQQEIENEIVALELEEIRETKELIGENPELQSSLNAKRFILITNDEKSMEFNLPIKKNDKSIQVLVIKKFLGLPFGSGDIFDEETKKALINWQEMNRSKILETMSSENVGNVQIDINVDFMSNPDFERQIGIVDTPTYLTMYKDGLSGVATQVFAELEDIRGSIRGTDDDPIKILSERDPGDTPSPAPWKDDTYIYYTWVSEKTRRDVNASAPNSYNEFLRKTSEHALRFGVAKVFDYYDKTDIWEIKGSRSSHQVYAPLLFYQNKIPKNSLEEDQKFSMTIKGQNLVENLGVGEVPDPDSNPDAQPVTSPPVDVLFGQSLQEGAPVNFAGIHKVHSPTKRPNSKFKFTIRIRKDLFDAVKYKPGSAKAIGVGDAIRKARAAAAKVKRFVSDLPGMMEEIGGEASERAQAAIDEVQKAGQIASQGIDWARKNKKEALKKGAAGAYNMAKKYSRAAELAKLDNLDGFVGSLPFSKAQEKAFQAALAAMDTARESMPVTTTFKAHEFEQQIDSVAELFFTYSLELMKWQLVDGGRMRPYIEFKKEAENLRQTKSAIKRIMSANGISFQNGDEFEIQFEEVLMTRSVTKKPPTFVEDRAGVVPVRISYKKKGKQMRDLVQGTQVFGNAFPWNSPRTMNYLMNLESMYLESLEDEKSCLEDFSLFGSGPPEKMFEIIQQYTTPYLVILKQSAKPMVDVGANIEFEGPVKRFFDKLNEDLNLDGKNPKSSVFREDMLRFERGKTYSLIDPIPKEDLCTLEQLYAEFLSKFDFEALFCSYAACIPQIPWPISFKWDFDFKIPELPRMPKFDPMAILIPMIEAAILEMLIAFLCGLVRGILDLIKFPSCSDLLEFGAAAFESAFGESDNTDKRLVMLKDAAASLEEMDIPVDSYSDLADLFDALSLALTPPEICSLLQGEADIEVLTITKHLIDSHASTISMFLTNESSIADFFLNLGKFIDPELCNIMANSAEFILGDVCPDGSPSIRDELMRQDATPEEIEKALIEAERRRAALKDLIENDPLEGFFDTGLPSPYENKESNSMADLATKTVLENVAIAFKFDVANWVPSLFESFSRQKRPGDPGFNAVEAAEYEFLVQALKEVKPRARLAGKISEGQIRQMEEVNQNGLSQEEADNAFAHIQDTDGLAIFGLSDPSNHVGDILTSDNFIKMMFARVAGQAEGRSGQGATVGFESGFSPTGGEDMSEDIGVEFMRTPSRSYWRVHVFGSEHIFRERDNAMAFVANELAALMASAGRIPKPGMPAKDPENEGYYKCVQMVGAAQGGSLSSPITREHLVDKLNSIVTAQRVRGRSSEFIEEGAALEQQIRQEIAALDEADENATPQFFDLSQPGDRQFFTDIINFPMRNLMDDTKPLPWMEYVLQNPDDVIDLGVVRRRPWSFGPSGRYDRFPMTFRSEPFHFSLKINLPPSAQSAMDTLDLRDTPYGRSAESVTYQEIPIRGTDLCDRYNIHRPNRLTFGSWKGKTHTEEIPDDIAAKRRAAKDFRQEDSSDYRLLRPAAFANLFQESWETMITSIYPDGHPALLMDRVSNYRNELWEKIEGKPVDAPDDSPFKPRGAYDSMVQHFIEKLSNTIADSPFFDLDTIQDFGNFISSEFLFQGEGDEGCYVKNDGVIDFEKIRQDIMKKYARSLRDPENDPTKRDFNQSGPLEKSIVSQLVIFYMKTYVIEFLLKGMFIFSVYGVKGIAKSEMIADYIYDYFNATFEGVLSDITAEEADQAEDSFMKEIYKVANNTDLREAVRAIVEDIIDSDALIEKAQKIYDPTYSSFKEFCFNEMLGGYPKSVVELRSVAPNINDLVGKEEIPVRRGMIPLHKSYDPKNPFGGNEIENIRDLEYGKFYTETYWRFSEAFIRRNIDGALTTILEDRLMDIPGAFENLHEEFITTRTTDVYRGVFSETELIDFIKFVNSLKITLSVPIRELADQITNDMTILGNLKTGLRLVFVPGLMTGVNVDRYEWEIQIDGENENAPPKKVEKTAEQIALQMAKGIITVRPEQQIAGIAMDETRRNPPGAEEGRINVPPPEYQNVNGSDITAQNPLSEDIILGNVSGPAFWYGIRFDHLIGDIEEEMRLRSIADTEAMETLIRAGNAEGEQLEELLHLVRIAEQENIEKERHNAEALRENPKIRRRNQAITNLRRGQGNPVYHWNNFITARTRSYIGDTTPSKASGVSFNATVDFNNFDIVNRDKVKAICKRWLVETVGFEQRSAAFINGSSIPFNPSYLYGVPFVELYGTPVDQEHPSGEGFVEQPQDHGIFTTKPLNVMFPTPLATLELDYCPIELLESEYVTSANPSDNALGDSIRIARSKDDDLIQQMMGLGPADEDGKRKMVSEPSFDVRYLFDFIFPLDRYASIFTLHNQTMFDLSVEASNAFEPTRGITRRLALTLKNTELMNASDQAPMSGGSFYNALTSDVTSNGFGDFAMSQMGDLGKMLEKLVAQFVPNLIRGLAGGMDPAYKDLKKKFDSDPAFTQRGLTYGSLSHGGNNPYTPETDYQDGFAKHGDINTYAPMNVQGPIDITVASGLIATGLALGPAGIPTVVKGVNDMLTIVARLDASIRMNNSDRYGRFLTPFGMLALGMGEHSGERHRDRVKKGKSRVFTVCEDEGVSSNQLGSEDESEVEEAQNRINGYLS